jgi:hypothetical protein
MFLYVCNMYVEMECRKYVDIHGMYLYVSMNEIHDIPALPLYVCMYVS